MNNTAAALQKLLGDDVVLLPVPRGEKKCVVRGWPNFTIERMRDPSYLASLNHDGNIGVLLGKNSSGICTIDIDRDKDVELFLEGNAKLRGTLTTRRGRGCNFWLRIKGVYPPLGTIRDQDGSEIGEWRATGGQTVIHGEARDREPPYTSRSYAIIRRSAPIEMEFKAIVWPENWALPWLEQHGLTGPLPAIEELKKLYGEPWYTNEEGQVRSIGEAFWAGLYNHENVVLFEPNERAFYRYNELRGLWQLHTEDAIRHSLSKRILKVSREACLPALEKHRTQGKLTAIVGQLRGIAERQGAFENKPRIVHVANGAIKVEGDDIRFTSFLPDYYSRNQSPIAYDDRAECPRFLNELLCPALAPEDILFVQKLAGLALLGFNLPQRIAIFEGPAGTGKTTTVNVLAALVDPANCSQLRTQQLDAQFELYRFLGKTLLIGSDVPGDFLMRRGAGVLKALVGGDFLDAEGKNLNGNFRLKGTFNVVITANERLKIRLYGDPGPWRRRLAIVRFKNEPPKRKIANFADLLIREEGSGILNLALAGLVKALEEIDRTGDLELTDDQRTRIDGLLAESESVKIFVKEFVIKDDAANVTTAELIERYAEFCADKGWSPMPITIAQGELTGLMLETHHVAQSHSLQRDGKGVGRGYRNVRLKI